MNIVAPSRTDPQLLDLQKRYADLNLFQHSNWESYQNAVDIENFRGERGYLSQLNYGHTPEKYAAAYEYAVNHGLQDLLRTFTEDGALGAITFTAPDGSLYSRDSLDSAFEIGFLRETLGLNADSSLSLLDIGAGYGRLLHRWCQAFPKAQALGIDGIPLSTYLCDYYTKFRQIEQHALTVPLDRMAEWSLHYCHIASNCYSFAELSLSSINYWLSLCAERDIPYFFLAPHDYSFTDAALVSHEVDGSNIDYYDRFAFYGYKLKTRRHKYQPRESSPKYVWGTEYLLFKRGG